MGSGGKSFDSFEFKAAILFLARKLDVVLRRVSSLRTNWGAASSGLFGLGGSMSSRCVGRGGRGGGGSASMIRDDVDVKLESPLRSGVSGGVYM